MIFFTFGLSLILVPTVFCLKYMIVDTIIAVLGQTALVEQSDHGLECLITSMTECARFHFLM